MFSRGYARAWYATVWAFVAACGVSLALSGEIARARSVTLDLWSPFADDNPITAELRAIAQAFEARNPGISVRITPAADITTKLKVAVAGGAPPDVTFANGGIIPNSATFGTVLEPLSPFMARDGAQQSYLPASFGSFGTWEGVTYAVPYLVDPNFAVLVNNNLWSEAGLDPQALPDSPDELIAAAQKVHRRDEKGQIAQMATVPWRMYGEHTALLNWSLGFGGAQLADGKRYTLTGPAVVTALEWMNEFAERFGGGAAVDAFAAQYQYYDLRHIAMQPMVSANAVQALKVFPDIDYGLTYLPAASGGTAPIWLGGQWLAIPNGAKHAEQAWQFIRFATLDLEAIRLSRLSRFAGARAAYTSGVYAESAFSTMLDRKMARIFAFYATLAPRAQPILTAPIWYWNDIATGVREVIVQRKMAPRPALAQLNERLNRRLDDEVYRHR